MIGSRLFARFRSNGQDEQTPFIDRYDESMVASILKIWLEQAASLQALGRCDGAKRKFELAENFACENVRARPESGSADFQLGSVYIASGKLELAEQCFLKLKTLGQRLKNSEMVSDAGGELLVVSRLKLAKSGSIDGEMAIERIIYCCQNCGRFLRYLSVPCPYCYFAPAIASQVALGSALSSLNFRVYQLVTLSREMQKGREPGEIVTFLDEIIEQCAVRDGADILEKLHRTQYDNHFDYKKFEGCPHCGTDWSDSWAENCRVCEKPLGRPPLQKMLVCIDHLLQHFVWSIERSEAQEFAVLILLLVDMGSALLRVQSSPSDAQRRLFIELISKIGTLTTENRAGKFTLNPLKISGAVVDPNAGESIKLFVASFSGELDFLVSLLSRPKGLV